jgi:DNA-binding transcriptional LysR family regulator
MVDTLLSMRVFAKVVETESFAEASRRLNLSPGVVTKHIQNLERRVGVRLLNRNTRRLGLTEAGAIYYERCIGVLAGIDEAEEAAAALSRVPRGRLRVSAAADFGPTELWPIIRSFMQKYPEISVELLLTDRMVNLIEEEIDLCVRMNERPLDPYLVARRLAVSKLVVCASPDYLRRAGAPKTPQDLQAHSCLVYGEARRHEGWEFKRDGRTQRMKLASPLQSNQIRLLKQAALDGAGIVMQPSFNVWRDIAEGRLTTVLDGWSAGELAVSIVHTGRKFLPTKTRLLIDHIIAAFPDGPNHDVWLARVQSRQSERTGRGSAKARRGAGARKPR